jgi:hypothetical protein
MCEKSLAIGRNNFPPARAEGGPDFASRRHRFDVPQLLKGRSEHFLKWLQFIFYA